MVVFETMKAEKKDYGRNNFLEVAKKKAITDDGETEFISVSKGYYLPDGTERFKKSIPIPIDPEMREFIGELIKTI